jgi:hypothetical protein
VGVYSFFDPETRKEPFRARVVKAKVALHRKIHGFGHTPDQKWPFRPRVVKALIFPTVNLHTFVHFSRLGVQKVNKSMQIYRWKKLTLSPLSDGMAIFGRECVQNHVFCDAKRPSPSPLSHGMAFFGAAGSKMCIPCESGGGFFLSLRFARECRTFLEGYAPAGPKMGILDESCEGFSAKSQKPS